MIDVINCSLVDNTVLDSENYIQIIEKFRKSFNLCHRLGLLQETEKAHHLMSPIHLEKVLTDTRETLWSSCAEGLEGKHRQYRTHQVDCSN